MRDVQNTSQSFIREMERAAEDHEVPHTNGTSYSSASYATPSYEAPAYEPPAYEPPVYPAPSAPREEAGAPSAADEYGIPDARGPG